MTKTEVTAETRRLRDAVQEAADQRRTAARAAWLKMRRRADDLASEAQARARRELTRRRDAAADALEGIAEALRPQDGPGAARARRTKLAMAGGSTLALTAALGAGVALGFLLSRELKKRKARALAAATSPEGHAAAKARGAGRSAGAELPDRSAEVAGEPLLEAADMEADYRQGLRAATEL